MISGSLSKHRIPVSHFPKTVGSPTTMSEFCTQFSVRMNVQVKDNYRATDPVNPNKPQDLKS